MGATFTVDGNRRGQFTAIGEILGGIHVKPLGTRRTGQPVRRHSYYADDPRAGTLWKRLAANNRDARRLIAARMKAAEWYDRHHKEPGERNGPLGHVGLEILRELYRIVDFKTGRLDPAIATICKRLRRSVDAVSRAMKRLKAHGFLDWVRRCEPIENSGPGPQVRQITNAYGLGLPEVAAAWVKRILGAGPPPDCDATRRAADEAELNAMIASLPLEEELELTVHNHEVLAILSRMVPHLKANSAILPNGENPVPVDK